MIPCDWTVQSSHWRGGTGPIEHLVALLDRGDAARSAGSVSRALAQYREAAAAVLATPKPITDSVYSDEILHLARDLALLRDTSSAQVLWKIYLGNLPDYLGKLSPHYDEQAKRLRAGNARDFFAAMSADSDHYTGHHPDDDGEATAIRAGVAAGMRGDLKKAKAEFETAIPSAAYSQGYSYYAYGAAAWLLGDRTAAREAWICGSDAGRDPLGDMAFNGPGNLGAVTMLVKLK